MVRSLPAVLAALALLAPAAAADSPDSTRLARMADYVDRLEAFGFSGQIVVAERGRVVLERACGWADRRFGVRMTGETRLGIGSVTKNFVAAAVLRLETVGKLKIEDPIGKFLPGVPADKAGITLAQLMCHTGGVGRDVEEVPDSADRDAVTAGVLEAPLADAPGTRFRYSDSGFDLLAAIVERVAQSSFDAFVRREFLGPAGLTATGVAGSRELPDGPAARGYNEWKEVSAWTEWPAGWKGTGSGRMVSTASDLARWAAALRDGRGLSAAEWQQMSLRHATREDSGGYGFGLHLPAPTGGRAMILIGGDVEGYFAECRIYPESQRVIVVLTNQELFGLGGQRRIIANTLSRLAQSLTAPLPPLPAAPGRSTGGVAPVDPAVGRWRLPTGGTIEIWDERGQLTLGARGQDAVDLFEPDSADSSGMRRGIQQATLTLMRAATSGDTTLAVSLLGREPFDFGYPFLARRLHACEALYAGLQSVRGLGTVALPWEPDALRSYVALQYADGEANLCLGWRAGKLYDVTFDEGRPFPAIYPVAPLAEGGYAAYDILRQRWIRLRLVSPAGATPRLLLAAVGGEIGAKRVR